VRTDGHAEREAAKVMLSDARQANQALIVKQGEITQLNKDGAGLVAEIAASAKRIRDLQTQAE